MHPKLFVQSWWQSQDLNPVLSGFKIHVPLPPRYELMWTCLWRHMQRSSLPQLGSSRSLQHSYY